MNLRIAVRPRARATDEVEDPREFRTTRQCDGDCYWPLWLSVQDVNDPADRFFCRTCAWVALRL